MTDSKPISILKMVDNAESNRVEKRDTFDLPMRLLIIGKSQLSGKTNLCGNLVLRPYGNDDITGAQFYKNDFFGRNIYIVCPSTKVDAKWQAIVKGKSVPDGNIFTHYDEQELESLYENLTKKYHNDVDSGRKPEHSLVIMDDVSWSGDLKGKLNGVISKFACNSRHYLISIIITSQKFSDVATTLRENATGMILYSCSQKQLELIYNDVGMQAKTEFCKLFRTATNERHSFMVVNYSNPPERRFLNSNFDAI